jgi:hypothetical protein
VRKAFLEVDGNEKQGEFFKVGGDVKVRSPGIFLFFPTTKLVLKSSTNSRVSGFIPKK